MAILTAKCNCGAPCSLLGAAPRRIGRRPAAMRAAAAATKDTGDPLLSRRRVEPPSRERASRRVPAARVCDVRWQGFRNDLPQASHADAEKSPGLLRQILNASTYSGHIIAGQSSMRVSNMTETHRPRVKYVIGPDGSPLTIADLPPATTKRWVIRRKAEVVAAVRGGLLSLEEACSRYTLTVDEFLCWQMSIDKHGLAGLRTTRIQQYRQ